MTIEDLGWDNLLLDSVPSENPLLFILMKCEFTEEGRNAPRGDRCENLSYGSLSPVLGTPYANQTWDVAHKSGFDDFEVKVNLFEKWGHIISVVPHFFIDYVQIKEIGKDGSPGTPDLEKNPTPSAMWYGCTIYQLFKNMREWSFMVEEPFNSDHPMAIYSKMAIDMLEIPQVVLNEIDAMPDMSLAKFLKGQANYRLIPAHPVISAEFKQWIVTVVNKYPTLTFEEKLNTALEGKHVS